MTTSPNDSFTNHSVDRDPQETAEWSESLEALVRTHGHERAGEILETLLRRSRELGVEIAPSLTSDYVNTIRVEDESSFPGNEELERQYRAWIRWNAAVLVQRAQRPGIGVGGHISTYASSAALYEVGFNHFFRGQDHPGGGDQIFIQGHASPGPMHAVPRRTPERPQLDGFRQEKSNPGGGLPSYRILLPCPNFGSFPPYRWTRAHQRDLSGAAEQICDQPWHSRRQPPTCVGVPR